MASQYSHTSFMKQKRDLSFHQFLKLNTTDFSSPVTAIAVDASSTDTLKVGQSGSSQPRRESFLYRPSIDEREFNRSASRTSSITSLPAQ